MLTKAQIRELPEYIGLPRKHQQYVIFVTLWEKTHTAACRILKLNRKRIAENPLIAECIDAVRQGVRQPVVAAAVTPEAAPQTVPGPLHNVGAEITADMAEVVRRIESLQGIPAGPQDTQFAATTFTYAADTATGRWLQSQNLPLELAPRG